MTQVFWVASYDARVGGLCRRRVELVRRRLDYGGELLCVVCDVLRHGEAVALEGGNGPLPRVLLREGVLGVRIAVVRETDVCSVDLEAQVEARDGGREVDSVLRDLAGELHLGLERDVASVDRGVGQVVGAEVGGAPNVDGRQGHGYGTEGDADRLARVVLGLGRARGGKVAGVGVPLVVGVRWGGGEWRHDGDGAGVHRGAGGHLRLRGGIRRLFGRLLGSLIGRCGGRVGLAFRGRGFLCLGSGLGNRGCGGLAGGTCRRCSGGGVFGRGINLGC